VLALGIATLKASLVGLFFMHLLHDKPMNALIFAVGFVLLGTLLMLTLIDAHSRLGTTVSSVPSSSVGCTIGCTIDGSQEAKSGILA